MNSEEEKAPLHVSLAVMVGASGIGWAVIIGTFLHFVR